MLSMVACREMLPLLPDDDVDVDAGADADEGCETADSTSASPVASHRSSTAQQALEDDELTSLSWLQNRNLLRVLRASEASAAAQNASRTSAGDAEYEDDTSASGAGFIPSDSPTSDYGDDCGDGSLEENFGHGSSEGNYDLRSRSQKPPYSFSSLIFMAIEASTAKALPVKDIYAWILGHFPYFASAPTGWKNSVRHNLSLNKCFRKVEREKGHMNIGKGSLWCIDPEFRPNLLQALRKVPYCSYQHLQLFTAVSATTPHASNRVAIVPSPQKCRMVSTKLAGNLPNPELFPYLSKRLAASTIKEQEVDAAATMLALKNGPGLVSPAATTLETASRKRVGAEENGIVEKRRKKWEHRRASERTLWPRRPTSIAIGEFEGPPAPLPSASVPVMTVVTCCPSEDHTYSTLSSPSPSSIDAAFEFSEPSRDGSVGSDADAEDEEDDDSDRAIMGGHRVAPPNFLGHRELRNNNSEQVEDEDEEQMKIVQGADALMNLAGIRGRERRIRRAAMERAQLR